jgi:hypothetical protein
MSQPNETPQPPLYVALAECTLDELDRRAATAEYFMNRALEQRRWNAVQYHRATMLAVQEECDRRLDALVDAPVTSRR